MFMICSCETVHLQQLTFSMWQAVEPDQIGQDLCSRVDTDLLYRTIACDFAYDILCEKPGKHLKQLLSYCIIFVRGSNAKTLRFTRLV